jgi:hypothetical protein
VVNVEGLPAAVDTEARQQGLSLYIKVADLPTLFARETRIYIPTSSTFFARNPFFLSSSSLSRRKNASRMQEL